jgi:hypothetical protein
VLRSAHEKASCTFFQRSSTASIKPPSPLGLADISDSFLAAHVQHIYDKIVLSERDKEVQIMLTQEMFDRMDRESYGDEREEKGMEKGMEKGESKFADLTGKLLSAGRIEDVKKASADPIYRKKLYEELQIQ